MKTLEELDEGLALAIQEFEKFRNDPELRHLALCREKFYRDQISAMNSAKREGFAEGIAEGEARGKAEGIAEGIAEAFLKLVQWTLGEPSNQLRILLSKETDPDKINRFYDMVLKKEIDSLEELERQFSVK